MTNSTRLRFGVLAAATAVVAAGLVAAVPANAATGTITLAKTAFPAGDWRTGLDVTGAGFTAGSVVTITVADSKPTTIDTHTVTADASGAFHELYIPATPLSIKLNTIVSVSATSDQGDTSNSVPLTVLLPESITTPSTSITTSDLKDSSKGVPVFATGYDPGEDVVVTVDYDGSTLEGGTYTADADGAVLFGLWLAQGEAVPGPFVIHVTGADSKVAQSITVTVTGDPIDEGTAPVVGGTETPAATAATGAKNLPVVSG